MHSKSTYLTIALVLGSIWSAGCATKGYVRSQVQPVNSRVEAVSQKTDKNSGDIQKTQGDLQQTNTKLDATTETANTADTRASDALNKTNENKTQISNLHSDLGNVVANIDAYKAGDQTIVHFGFNKDTLTPEDKTELDTLANEASQQKRYFITVQGYTDQTGPASYNNQLSQRRANAVIEYLVAQHQIPIQRIHMVGLGENDLINDGKTRQDRAQSRRVQVVIWTAPALSTSSSQ